MRNTHELRQALIQDLEGLRAGTIPRPEARARAYLARQIIDTIKVEAVAAAMNTGGYRAVMLFDGEDEEALTIAAE